MKVIEHFHVPAQELDKWIKKHMDEDIRVEYDLNTNTFHMTSVQNVTESDPAVSPSSAGCWPRLITCPTGLWFLHMSPELVLHSFH